MFKKFFRGRDEPAGAGTGLGLAICAAVARLHHGTMEAASHGGARFTLTLPQALPQASPLADDYLSKPFGVAELHARLRVALRHAAQTGFAGQSTLRCAGVEIDFEAKRVERAGEPVRLTATEWRLLDALAKHAGRVVTTKQLLRDVWGPGHAEQGHYLRIYVRQLRQKLEANPARPTFLLTETGLGYRLLVDPCERVATG